MSRWDPEPSSTERWLVRHRTPVRVGAVLLIVFAIGQIAYLMATGGALGWSLGGSISLITSPCLFLFLVWSASSHVSHAALAASDGRLAGSDRLRSWGERAPGARPAAARFVGGDSAAAAVATALRLRAEHGITASLFYLGSTTTTPR
jgi:hypothetical protein